MTGFKFIVLAVSLLIFFSSELYSQYYYNEFASFDGADDYFSTPANSELNIDTAFTIEVWVFVKDTSGFNKVIFSSVNADNNSGYSLLVKGSSANPGSAGRIQFNLNGTNNVITQSSGTKLSLNSWNHIAVTFKDAGGNNSDTTRFYLNGTQVMTLNRLIEPVSNSSDSLRIGNCYLPGNYSNAFKGFIDDLRIYKTRRPVLQIANDRGVPVSMDEIQNVNLLANTRYSSLTAAWTFNGNGNDYVGIKNNLKSVNGTQFIASRFNPVSYRNQSNYFIKLTGQSWLAGADSVNSGFDADTACTLEAYVFPDTAISTVQTIISKGNNYSLGISSNKFFFAINSNSRIINSFSSVKIKEWNHIAATYSGNSGMMNIYINGLQDSSKIFSPGNIAVTNDSLYLGKSNTGEFLFGKLDEVRISRAVIPQSLIFKFLHTGVDNINAELSLPPLVCFGFEGNTLDAVSRSKPLLIRGDAFFEWINNSISQSSQAPLIRTKTDDNGDFSVRSSKSFSVRNNSTVRDSLFVPNTISGSLTGLTLLMSHSYMDDADISLRSPNGTTVNLSTDYGGTFNDICVKFTNTADSSLSDLKSPFSMLIKPIGNFSTFTGLPAGYWRLTVTDDNATNLDSGRVYMWAMDFGPLSGISENVSALDFRLEQNYPNPFNPATAINYKLGYGSFVTLKVFNVQGKSVATLVNEKQEPGSYSVNFDASDLSSGIYYYKLSADNYNDTKKMILLK